jgi:hypothetical protein
MEHTIAIDRELLRTSIERLQKLGGLRPPAEEERLLALKALLKDQLKEHQIHLAFAELLASYNLMTTRTIDKLKERVLLFFGPSAKGAELQILGIALMGAEDALLGKEESDELIAEQLLHSYGLGSAKTSDTVLPKAEGRFGYEPGNPVLVNGIDQLNNYLDKLSLHTGEAITYRRRGSLSQKGFPYPLDRYEISNSAGELCATLFFYAYHGSTSQTAPEGFRFQGD